MSTGANIRVAGFLDRQAGNLNRMEQQNVPPATPKDATKATEEQRDLQEQLNHQDEDPNAPGGHETRHQIADET
jgi:hypothetical protein